MSVLNEKQLKTIEVNSQKFGIENRILSLITSIYLKEKNTYIDDLIKDELLKNLNNIDIIFLARLSIYIRFNYDLTSISFFIAIILAGKISGKKWAKDYYYSLIKIPDDMLQILSGIKENENYVFSNAMKKGFCLAINKFDNYQLLKCQNENKDVKLRDLFNLIHPKPNDLNRKSIELIMNQQFHNRNFQVTVFDIDKINLINEISYLKI